MEDRDDDDDRVKLKSGSDSPDNVFHPKIQEQIEAELAKVLDSNTDYQSLRSVSSILQRQKQQNDNDIKKLNELLVDAISSPVQFVSALNHGTLDLPQKQVVPSLPLVQYADYSSVAAPALPLVSASGDGNANDNDTGIDEKSGGDADGKPQPQINAATFVYKGFFQKRKTANNNDDDGRNQNPSQKLEQGSAAGGEAGSGAAMGGMGGLDYTAGLGLGPKTRSKAQSGEVEFTALAGNDKKMKIGDPWTEEEQQKLELLLVRFPDEAVATDRWKKIADAIPTRNWRQVSSRTQKYFRRLAREGLPIPGRRPILKRSQYRHKRAKYVPDRTPRDAELGAGIGIGIGIGGRSEDEGSVNGGGGEGSKLNRRHGRRSDVDEDSDEDMFLRTLAGQLGRTAKDSKEYVELVRLRKIEKRRNNEERGERVIDQNAIHDGFMCDSCGMEPIVGILWQCVECVESVDLCDSCHSLGSFETASGHLSSHQFRTIREAEQL